MNSLNMDLTGKMVVVSDAVYEGDKISRIFLCKTGFGCRPFTMGRAIGGEFVTDGESCRIEGDELERLATQEEIDEANIRRDQHGKPKLEINAIRREQANRDRT